MQDHAHTDPGLLDEVDHPRVRVGHLPVFGQGLQVLVSHHVISEVHGAVGLVVTRDSLHPIGWLRVPLSVFCSKQEGYEKQVSVYRLQPALCISNRMPHIHSPLPCLLCPHSAVRLEKTNRNILFFFFHLLSDINPVSASWGSSLGKKQKNNSGFKSVHREHRSLNGTLTTAQQHVYSPFTRQALS